MPRWRALVVTYIDELKQYHNPRYCRGPVGGNYYAGTSFIQQRAVWRQVTMATPDVAKRIRRWRKAQALHRVMTARPDGSDWFRRQITYRFHSRRRAAQSETEPNDVGKRVRQTETDGSATDVLEVHKGWHIQYNIVSRETPLSMRKHPTSTAIRSCVWQATRLLHRALSPDAQDDIIARTEHAL